MIRCIHIPGMYHTSSTYIINNSSSSTCVPAVECYCFLRLVAAVVRLHPAGTRACSRCVVVYPLIWSRRICTGTFSFCSGYFLPNQPQSTLVIYGIILKQHQRCSVGTASEGGCITSAGEVQCGLLRGSWSCCWMWTVLNETNSLIELS